MSQLDELKTYLDSQVDVTDNPHDNLYLYRHHMLQEHKIKSSDENFFDEEYIEEYIADMKRIGWKSPEDRVKFIREVESNETPKKKQSHFEKFWSQEDYRVYVILQIGLYYSGHQTAAKTAEILHVTIPDVWNIAKKLDGLFSEEGS
jgi:hypothetical protein